MHWASSFWVMFNTLSRSHALRWSSLARKAGFLRFTPHPPQGALLSLTAGAVPSVPEPSWYSSGWAR